MPTFAEMDPAVTFAEQSEPTGDDEGPVVLVNTLTVPPEDADRLLAAWTAEAEAMRGKSGVISIQLHRGIAGSGTFMNYVVWESLAQMRAAAESPEFKASIAAYPDSATLRPHLLRRVAVSGICLA